MLIMSPKFNTLSLTHFSDAYRTAPIAKSLFWCDFAEINSNVYCFFAIVIYPSLTSTEYNLVTLVDDEIVVCFVNKPIRGING